MQRMKRWAVVLGVAVLALWLLWLWGSLAQDRSPDSVQVWPKPGTRAWKDQERLTQARREAELRTPYRMKWPLKHQIAAQMEYPFRVAMMADGTEFRESLPRVAPSPGEWFVYLTVVYSDPQTPADPTWRPHIDEAHVEPLRIARGAHPHEDELVLTSIAFPEGNHLRFNCYGANHLKAFQEATTAAQLALVEWPGLCRAFMSLRPGVQLMVQFPIDKADVAHRGVTQAIALMDRSIVDQPPLEK